MSDSTSGLTIAVIGAGGWGTALSSLLAGKGYSLRLWAREEAEYEPIQSRRENTIYLPGVRLPDNIHPTLSKAEAVDRADLIIVAVPGCGIVEVAQSLAEVVTSPVPTVSATKGFELERLRRPSEVLLESLGEAFRPFLCVLSGPNLSREVVQGIPSVTVIASRNEDVARHVQQVFTTHTFRVYTNPDLIGVELGGALKNIIAIGAGINDGLGFGDNTKAAVASRGLVEIARLGVALGAQSETFFGLAGMGDMIATCASHHSRNWQVGYRLAKGEKLADILASVPTVAEGVPTTRAALALAKSHGIEMPITEQIHAVLFENKPPLAAVNDLMERQARSEREELSVRLP